MELHARTYSINFTDPVAEVLASRTPARLLEYSTGSYVALPVHTTYAVMEHPAAIAVPGMADYGYGLLPYQDGLIPMIDLRVLLRGGRAGDQTPRYALVVAYLDEQARGLRFGAIGLSTLPETVMVGDEEMCGLPDDSPHWTRLALSCFRYRERVVPILSTTRIFFR